MDKGDNLPTLPTFKIAFDSVSRVKPIKEIDAYNNKSIHVLKWVRNSYQNEKGSTRKEQICMEKVSGGVSLGPWVQQVILFRTAHHAFDKCNELVLKNIRIASGI